MEHQPRAWTEKQADLTFDSREVWDLRTNLLRQKLAYELVTAMSITLQDPRPLLRSVAKLAAFKAPIFRPFQTVSQSPPRGPKKTTPDRPIHRDPPILVNSAPTFSFANLTLSCLKVRDACACSICVDPSTKQRNFETSDLDEKVSAANVVHEGNRVAIVWNERGGAHISTYAASDLTRMAKANLPRHKRISPLRILWNKDDFAKNQHWISFDDYMSNDNAFRLFMRSLSRYGLVFVKGVPRSTESVSQIATRMGPLRNSFYGSTWDVRSVPDAKNVAYTNKFLGFHMDLLYMADPPGYQLLHCMDNSLPGGESLFSDAVRVAQNISEEDRAAYDDLCNTPVRFGYFNDGQRYEYTRPTIQAEGNSMVHVNYSPPFQVPQFDFSGREGSTFSRWTKSMELFSGKLNHPDGIFELKLKEGECVIFANRRVVHARKEFDLKAGDDRKRSRWLRGAYVDEDALISKFEYFREQNPKEWLEKN
ncbi:hypothetical protein LOZ61_006143 [Ophidiomyces ophidiicola]|nr:hypothetical protein LOZ61_006143 [Ophidiomyces ophidiicola]KAI1922497.1 hypothetical protein LOZ60_005668 [Ophidiomyces ophidiicola]KAI2008320.1 hypothetical protein LOZ49_004315 [Ophidiomyces ophidiicola]KAI2020896.1 hypothetical protein LOZ45_004942 [Ophidiomyces ophidiicola]KAI2094878.1 hypothetical protein LOZ33_004420 [Ophidiomyces ophidiicola]